jgi:hypothetical protein
LGLPSWDAAAGDAPRAIRHETAKTRKTTEKHLNIRFIFFSSLLLNLMNYQEAGNL